MDPKVKKALQNAIDKSEYRLHEHEVHIVLQSANITSLQYQYFKLSEEDAIKQYIEPGKLYVLKADAPDIANKTRKAAIVTNLNSENAEGHLADFKTRFDNLHGYFITEVMPNNTEGPSNGEFLLSAYRDQFFGPQICLGLGGVNSDEFQQILTIPALQEFNIDEYKDTLVYKSLTGKLTSVAQCTSDENLVTLVKKVQKLIRTPPEDDFPYVIQQIEINPIVFKHDRGVALDAFVQLEPIDRKTWELKAQLLFDHKNISHLRRLKYLFAPHTVAIAGVSTKNPRNPGSIILNKLKNFYNNTDSISIIHPRETEYDGIKCYKQIQELPQKPDLYIIATQADQAAKQLLESCEGDVSRAIFIISAGFDETVAGKHYVDSLRQCVRQRGIVQFPIINGPNTLGYFYRNFTTTFTQDWRSSVPEKYEFGDFAVITQSGACLLETKSALGKIQPTFALSVGNQIDLSVIDTLQWFLDWEEDDQNNENQCERLKQLQKDRKNVRVFGLYIEGLKEGEGNRLLLLIKKAIQQKKIIIIYKAGRTRAGTVSVSGHTASFAGSYQQFKSNVEKAGACVMETYTEFMSLLQTSYLTYNKFTNLGTRKQKYYISAVTNAGFQKCQVGDLLFKTPQQAAQVVEFNDQMQQQLDEFFKKHDLAKIVDVCRILDVTPMLGQDGLIDLAKLLIRSDAVDILLITLLPECESLSLLSVQDCKDIYDSCEYNENGLVKQLIKFQKEINKPIIVSVSSGYKYQKTRQLLLDAGIPAFEQICDAAVCIRHLTDIWAKSNSA